MNASQLVEQMAMEKAQLRQANAYLQQLLLAALSAMSVKDVVRFPLKELENLPYDGFQVEQLKRELKITLHRREDVAA